MYDSISSMMDAPRRLAALERSRGDIAEALVLVRAEAGFSEATNNLEDSLSAIDELIGQTVSLCQQAICVADKRSEFEAALDSHNQIIATKIIAAREAVKQGENHLRKSIAAIRLEPGE